MHRVPASLRHAGRRLLVRGRDEDGFGLVEVMVSAVLVVVVGLGVLTLVNRTTQLSGEQKAQAIATNLAQTEIDTVKSFPISELSNMRRSTTQTVAGVSYTITTRGDWVNDTSTTPSCATPGAKTDYLKIKTTVTHVGSRGRRPAVLDTIISPSVRAFDANQGSLSVFVKNALGVGVPGMTVSLTGPASFTDDTSANGCVLWGYLPAGNYTVSMSRTGWVTPLGAATAGSTVTVVGDTTTNVSYRYDQGGSIRTNFKVKNAAGNLVDTKPGSASVNNGAESVFKTFTLGATATSVDTTPGGLLFPGTYEIYADSCASAKPLPPAAPTPAPLLAGGSLQAADTILPAMHITVTNNGTAVSGAKVSVTTACGTIYQRTTNSTGTLDDPGFPYGTGIVVCASDSAGARWLKRSARTNIDYNTGTLGTPAATAPLAMGIGTTDAGSVTSKPAGCP